MRNILITLGALFLLSGCESNSRDSPVQLDADGIAPLDFEPASIAERVAAAYCSAFARCKSDIRLEFLRYQSVCVESIATVLERDLDALSSFVEAGAIEYDASSMDECIRAIESSTCWALETENFEEACARPLRGTSMVGQTCQLDSECDRGFCPGEDGCSSTCQPLSGIGDSCATDGERQCEAGLDCNVDQVCVEKTALAFRAAGGERCEVVRCEPGFHCARLPDQTSVCRSTTARFTLEQGESCPNRMQTYSDNECAPGLICQYESESQLLNGGRCAPVPVVGDTCSVAREVPEVWCDTGSYCAGLEPAQGEFVGRCEPLPSQGMVCGEHLGNPRFCAAGLLCSLGECIGPMALGGACADSSGCLEGLCLDGVCTPVCSEGDGD